jgi:class 3 adenylate cyclase
MIETNDRKLAAIIFTDIVNYTETMQRDEQSALNMLDRKRRIVTPFIKINGGKKIKEIGDAFLIMFDSVIQASRCAIRIQQEFEIEKIEDFSIRIGIHFGDVKIQPDGDILGSGVNIASRIHSLVKPKGICISSDAWNLIRNQSDLKANSLGFENLKGVGQVEILELIWEKSNISINLDMQKPVTKERLDEAKEKLESPQVSKTINEIQQTDNNSAVEIIFNDGKLKYYDSLKYDGHNEFFVFTEWKDSERKVIDGNSREIISILNIKSVIIDGTDNINSYLPVNIVLKNNEQLIGYISTYGNGFYGVDKTLPAPVHIPIRKILKINIR